ncbi:LysR family transcriptional regulator [Salinarimonas sp. NSM]|uniref:LysR family transcriptional regulator n=1 Tax=Salinarimonas sp. NSM TaxID=3458003 RepID=UPI0040374FA9
MRASRIGIRHLRTCVAVADAGSFRRASEALAVVQPAITKTVKDTEEDLGFAIFERTTRSVVVTEAGASFLADARTAVALFERTVRAARRNESGTRGHVIVGYSALATSSALTRALERFQRACPDVQVEMHVLSTDTMTRRLADGTIDVGFLLDHASVARGDLTIEPLWHDPLALVAPRAALPESVRVDELADQAFVMGLRENWRSYRLLLDEALAPHGLRPRVVDEVWDVQVMFQRVADGKGVTIYPASIAESLPAQLSTIPIRDLEARATIGMAYHEAADTGLLRRFRSYFTEGR